MEPTSVDRCVGDDKSEREYKDGLVDVYTPLNIGFCGLGVLVRLLGDVGSDGEAEMIANILQWGMGYETD